MSTENDEKVPIANTKVQVLTALNDASQDLHRKFSECTEKLTKINELLDNQMNRRLDRVSAESERLAQVQLSELNSERDFLMTDLLAHKEEELKNLYAQERHCTQELSNEVDGIILDFKTQSQESIKEFQELLFKTESNCRRALASIKRAFSEQVPDQKKMLFEEIQKETKLHHAIEQKDAKLIEDALENCSEQLLELCLELRESLVQSGADFLNGFIGTSEELNDSLQRAARVHIETMEESLDDVLDVLTSIGEQRLEDCLKNFRESSDQIASRKKAMHSAALKKLSIKYQSHLLSIERETSASMSIMQNELQTELKKHREYYEKRAELLLKKFERSYREKRASDLHNDEEVEPPAYMLSKISKLKQELREQGERELSEVAISFDQESEKLRLRMDSARKDCCAMADEIVLACKTELRQVGAETRSSVQELRQESAALDELIREAKSLMKIMNSPT